MWSMYNPNPVGRSVPATTDATVDPAPVIEVQNANLVIDRVS